MTPRASTRSHRKGHLNAHRVRLTPTMSLAKALSLAPLRAQDEGGVAVGLLSPLHGDEAGPKGDNEGADAELEARV